MGSDGVVIRLEDYNQGINRYSLSKKMNSAEQKYRVTTDQEQQYSFPNMCFNQSLNQLRIIEI